MLRTAVATVVGLIGFAAYVAVAIALADDLPQGAWPLRALYFVVAGSLWVLPARSLMLWAARH